MNCLAGAKTSAYAPANDGPCIQSDWSFLAEYLGEEEAMHDQFPISRRLTSRVPTPNEVWVLWSCRGRDDVSRVRDISVSGLFLETETRVRIGEEIGLHFLVQEGQIRAVADVRHSDSHHGLGLKFSAVKGEDRPRLEALIDRFRAPAPATRLSGQLTQDRKTDSRF